MLVKLYMSDAMFSRQLVWFLASYIGRFLIKFFDGRAPPSVEFKYGVPQGSVPGPVLFTVYTSPLAETAHRHGLGLEIHLYADDTQLYITFKSFSTAHEEVSTASIASIEACISELRTAGWSRANFKLNDANTELLFIIIPQTPPQTDHQHLHHRRVCYSAKY